MTTNKTCLHITITGPQNSGALALARAVHELLQGTDIQATLPEEAENPTEGDSIEALGYLTREAGPLHVTIQTRNDTDALGARLAALEEAHDRMLPIYTAHLAQEQRAAEHHEREQERVAALTEHQLHCEQRHPDYEYATTENARKNGGDPKPESEGWEPNAIVLITNGLFGPTSPPQYRYWERHEYTETNYWRRRKSAKEQA